ncbi:MAG TPA: hypothetical protein VN673_03455, partial [Clostridia bacterium]|nr:hypothetical protein [Clostridia bacterium]
VYTGVGSIFYAQRQGASATADKINTISLWVSSSAPFAAADPGTAPDSVVVITNTSGGLWLEYLLTNTLSGQYFLLKLDQTASNGNPGGNEFRLGANLGLPPTVFSVTPGYTNAYTGNAVQFTVQATGTAPLTYQWQGGAVGSGIFTNLVNGANISGANEAVLTLRNLALADMDVQVAVANSLGSAISTPAATLTVSTSGPQIITTITPETLQQASGYAFSLSVGAAGSLPITYQWKRNGLALANDARISGANSNVLTIANAGAEDAGTYQLALHNAYGDTTSSDATVTIVPSLPVIGSSGAIYSNVRDSSHFNASYVAANLFTHNVAGLAPGSTLSGAEFARSGAGSAWVAFEVDASYPVGSIYFAQRAGANTGDNMQKVSIWASESAAFETVDPGTAPAAVISLLPNSGTPVWREYFLPGTLPGRYFLLKLEQTTITGNPGGNEFRLGMAQQTPAIVNGPTNQVAYSGNLVQFHVGASGGAPLAYQWQSRPAGSASAFVNLADNATVSGATTATLTLRSVPLANVEYRVTVSNPAGSVTSDAATLTVSTSAPQIVVDASPAAIRQPAGYSFSLAVQVVGSGPITYQWQRGGQPLSNGGRISGANSNVLTVADAQAGDAGTYRLVMNNTYGNNTSAEVAVTIEPGGLAFYDGSAWTLNNGATIDASSVLTLTDGTGGQFRSAFFNTVVPVEAFNASFIYQDVNLGTADGAAFILHNAPAGPAALGPGGGYLGYLGITPSAALTFNLYNNPGMALRTGGTVGGYTATTPVNIASGAPIQVDIKYAAGTMVVVLTDTWTAQSYTNTYSIDLPAAVGGSTAYIGFSGADGAVTSQQQISAFSFSPITGGAPELIADIKPAQLSQPAGLSFSLSAAVAGTAPMTYQWKRNGVSLANDARISGAQSSRLNIAQALPGDVGNYQLFATNAYGWTNTGVAVVTLTNTVALGDGTAWTLNGGATLTSELLLLTDGGNSQARSAFLSAPVPIDGFVAKFTYTDLTIGGADGAAFILHNDVDGAGALGAGGGALGYSEITPSAALEFNIYENSPGGRGIAFATNGLNASSGGPAYSSTAPVNLASGNPIDVVLHYTGGVLSVTLTDAVAVTTFTTNYMVNLPAIVKGRTAYMGFSGGTGGITAVQQITNVKFVPMPPVAIQQNGASTVISWPVTPAGFALEQTSDLGSGNWQAVTAPVVLVDGNYQVVLSAPQGGQFYRLALP